MAPNRKSFASQEEERQPLRRVLGHVRRLSTLERRSTDQPRPLSVISEADSKHESSIDSSKMPSTLAGTAHRLPPLSKSVKRLSLSDEIQKELRKINQPLSSPPASVANSESLRAASREIDQSPISKVRSVDESIRTQDFAQLTSGPNTAQQIRLRTTASDIPSFQLQLRRPLHTSSSIPYVPDSGLCEVLQQTIRAQNALGASQGANTSPFLLHTGEVLTPQSSTDNVSCPREALENALASAIVQTQVLSDGIVAEAMLEVINLLKVPQSKQRDAGIRAAIDTIPRNPGAAINYSAPNSQDIRLLAVIRNLKLLLEVD